MTPVASDNLRYAIVAAGIKLVRSAMLGNAVAYGTCRGVQMSAQSAIRARLFKEAE